MPVSLPELQPGRGLLDKARVRLDWCLRAETLRSWLVKGPGEGPEAVPGEFLCHFPLALPRHHFGHELFEWGDN